MSHDIQIISSTNVLFYLLNRQYIKVYRKRMFFVCLFFCLLMLHKISLSVYDITLHDELLSLCPPDKLKFKCMFMLRADKYTFLETRICLHSPNKMTVSTLFFFSLKATFLRHSSRDQWQQQQKIFNEPSITEYLSSYIKIQIFHLLYYCQYESS